MNKIITSNIRSIGLATPQYKYEQKTILDFMLRTHQCENGNVKRLKAMYRASGIKYRYSVLEDYDKEVQDFRFYPANQELEPFPSTSQRMSVYKQNAFQLAEEAINDCLKPLTDVNLDQITHLITVSCTGMTAPGLDLEIIEKMNLNRSIQRTSINFMGCHAAFNALKIADSICSANPESLVLVVCVELCTLHFQKENTENYMLANSLFSDGSAAALISPQKGPGINFSIKKFYCDVDFQGKKDMTWDIGEFGFEMTLSLQVPQVIKSGIARLSGKLLKDLALSLEEIDFFAIHPGGKKILRTIEDELKIEKGRNRFAYEILRNYGNMSSSTIFFVLRNIWDQLSESDSEKNVLSFAFGPGLTLESMLLEIDYRS